MNIKNKVLIIAAFALLILLTSSCAISYPGMTIQPTPHGCCLIKDGANVLQGCVSDLSHRQCYEAYNKGYNVTYSASDCTAASGCAGLTGCTFYDSGTGLRYYVEKDDYTLPVSDALVCGTNAGDEKIYQCKSLLPKTLKVWIYINDKNIFGAGPSYGNFYIRWMGSNMGWIIQPSNPADLYDLDGDGAEDDVIQDQVHDGNGWNLFYLYAGTADLHPDYWNFPTIFRNLTGVSILFRPIQHNTAIIIGDGDFRIGDAYMYNSESVTYDKIVAGNETNIVYNNTSPPYSTIGAGLAAAYYGKNGPYADLGGAAFCAGNPDFCDPGNVLKSQFSTLASSISIVPGKFWYDSTGDCSDTINNDGDFGPNPTPPPATLPKIDEVGVPGVSIADQPDCKYYGEETGIADVGGLSWYFDTLFTTKNITTPVDGLYVPQSIDAMFVETGTDCATLPATPVCLNSVCAPKPQCSDGIDNDLDGVSDINDPGCYDDARFPGYNSIDNDETNTLPQCSDHFDNDGDTFIDLLDIGCENAADNDETNPLITPQCSDGIDNDGDLFIDYPQDPGCDSIGDNDEFNLLGGQVPIINATKGVAINLAKASGSGLIGSVLAGNGFILPLEQIDIFVRGLSILLNLIILILIVLFGLSIYHTVKQLKAGYEKPRKLGMIWPILFHRPQTVYQNHAWRDNDGSYINASYHEHQKLQKASQKSFQALLLALGAKLAVFIALLLSFSGLSRGLAQTAPYNQSGTTVNIGDTLTYIIEVTNSGDAAGMDIKISDILDNNLTYVKGSAKVNNVSISDPDSGNTLTFSVGNLELNKSVYVTFKAIVNAGSGGATIINRGQVTGFNFNIVTTEPPTSNYVAIPAPVCGNGLLESGEICENNSSCASGQVCNRSCVCQDPPPPPIVCGNGVLESGEVCDVVGCQVGQSCNAACQCITLPVCGNGVVEAPEICDGVLGCALNQNCINNCSLCQTPPPPSPVCGNGVIEAPEICDGSLGCAANQTCVNNCSLCQTPPPPSPVCGNGVIEAPEICDGSLGCAANQNCVNNCSLCQAPTPGGNICGNLIVERNEQCELDKDCQEGYSCRRSDCTCQPVIPPAICGNGKKERGEECENNSECFDGKVCNNDCACQIAPPPPPVCGNGVIEQGEVCDLKVGCLFGQICNIGCRCQLIPLPPSASPFCGDGVVTGEEECENNSGCTDKKVCNYKCKCQVEPPPPPVCGNGIIETGESCDVVGCVDGQYCSACQCQSILVLPGLVNINEPPIPPGPEIIEPPIIEPIIEVIDNPQVEIVSQNIATPIILTIAVANTLPILIMLVYLWAYLYMIFLEPFMYLFRKKREKWGIVYDSLSKMPIDLALVRLFRKNDNKLIQTKVTDREGRYIFVVEETGEYYISVIKPGYIYPTRYLQAEVQDAKFIDLYHGEGLNVTEKSAVITANIPLDPSEKIKLPVQDVIRSYAIKNLRIIVSYAGLLLAFIIFIIYPTLITGCALILHILLYTVFSRIMNPGKPKSWGIIYDKSTKKPLKSSVVRIFNTRFNKLLETQVTDSQGRYAFLVGQNHYQLLSEKPGYQPKEIAEIDLVKTDKIINLDIGLEKK
ncbi:MAG: isopeptide-forming domain-containing fimbrial protein [Candidatus Parcubacteria bacterium]|nr:isopeptide-forming domain-containing fimbrial protein [Candidatus Parcubacteria bacterium]